jgi:hypothetical protein
MPRTLLAETESWRTVFTELIDMEALSTLLRLILKSGVIERIWVSGLFWKALKAEDEE